MTVQVLATTTLYASDLVGFSDNLQRIVKFFGVVAGALMVVTGAAHSLRSGRWGPALFGMGMAATVNAVVPIMMQLGSGEGSIFIDPFAPGATTTSASPASSSAPSVTATTAPSPRPAATTTALPATPSTTAGAPTQTPVAEPVDWQGAGKVVLIIAIAAAALIGMFFGAGALRDEIKVRRAQRLKNQEAVAKRIEDWQHGVEVLDGVEESYRAFELDVAAVLWERAFLADTTEPRTIAFHEARQRALDLKLKGVPETQMKVDEFVAAAAAVRNSFDEADKYARKLGAAGFLPGGGHLERGQIDKLRKTVTLAYHPDTPVDEAAQAQRTAKELVERWGIKVPKHFSWQTALEGTSRLALPAASVPTAVLVKR
ncbi:hypothetical protein [Mycobacteroides abscessus]|uniref:Uncharacterized protein n=1 Tax=Mycobacteroides abscessus TaxID=36809 RepID=A0A0U0ZRT9_9MYCO|nr:hypothetical protein [Mycobacteroides abscessus]CPV67069.1 Uncharacterised protein [Mycobacteroides abscessus]